ncbi:hypothetical protein JCM11641_006425 [Rhodosporidiobolus odoratus]
MGRSAKMMKRPSKQDRQAKKINSQSTSTASRQPLSDDDDDDDAPSAIPLFNTSARGRATTKPDPREDRLVVPQLVDQSGQPSMEVQDASGSRPLGGQGGQEEEEEGAASGKKKGGLKDKVKRAKEALRADQARTEGKLGGGGAKTGGKGHKGKKEHVLKGVDYVELHEKVPGKKRFR